MGTLQMACCQGAESQGLWENRGVLAQHRGPRMGSVRPPDAKGGATLEANDVLSLCKDLSRSSTCVFPGNNSVCACIALRPPVLQTLSPSGGSSRPCSLAFLKSRVFGFSEVPGSLQGCVPPPWWLGWGLCLDSAQISGGKRSIAAAWNCHVCLRPEEGSHCGFLLLLCHRSQT